MCTDQAQERRWEDEIKMGLTEIGWGRVEWIQLAQDRDRWRAVVSAVMNLRVLAPLSWFCVQICDTFVLRKWLTFGLRRVVRCVIFPAH
jgi:hypothetical protein